MLLFTSDDDTTNHRRARALATALGPMCRVVNKLGHDLDDLLLVALHRVVEVPMWLVVRNHRVLLRLRGIPDAAYARQLLACV